jgi:hypothetical protein
MMAVEIAALDRGDTGGGGEKRDWEEVVVLLPWRGKTWYTGITETGSNGKAKQCRVQSNPVQTRPFELGNNSRNPVPVSSFLVCTRATKVCTVRYGMSWVVWVGFGIVA